MAASRDECIAGNLSPLVREVREQMIPYSGVTDMSSGGFEDAKCEAIALQPSNGF